LVRGLEQLGHKVTLEPTGDAARRQGLSKLAVDSLPSRREGCGMGADGGGARELPRSKDTGIDPAYQSVKAAEMARKRAVRYRCWDCGQEFSIQITGREQGGSLYEGHEEACPGCGRVVGKGRVKCRRCQGEIILTLPHWHVCCDLAAGNCPQCGEAYSSMCIC
jgi:DNA-directed RNA polymerase subunit RPC12/RpoP